MDSAGPQVAGDGEGEGMNADEFKAKTGHEPKDDDLERVNCPEVGAMGHAFCGWCVEHDRPRFHCGHLCQRNDWIQPEQRKLEAALEYLKSRADAHPEWRIEKTSATAERMWKEANVGSYMEISR